MPVEIKEIIPELALALQSRDFSKIREILIDWPALDLANLIGNFPREDRALLFRFLPRLLATQTFEYLSLDKQHELLKGMASDEIAIILNAMAPDDRTVLFEELPGVATKQMLNLLSPDERAVAILLLGYPDGSVGRLMTPDYISVHPDWSVQQVLDHIRQHGQDSETLNLIYVVDNRGILIDDVRMRVFLLAPLTNRVADLMDTHFISLKATDMQGSAVPVFRRSGLTALPVTDSDGMLIGIVTIDDVLDIAEAVATEKIQKIGGSQALDEPYINISFLKMIKKRAGWLVVLFIGELFTATAMGFFEKEIAQAVVLALFIPLIISSGGNAGSQAATLVIRALSLGEVGVSQWWKIMKRELLAGLTLGGILGGIGFMRIAAWSLVTPMYGPHWLLLAITVGVALVGTVLWGTLSGSMLPLLLQKLGFDPAVSSSPLVATLVDVTGLVIYFGMAMWILKGTLLF
jgi:magnesium transporter